MKFVSEYSLEIFSVVIIFWITASAIWMRPHFIQQLSLAYGFLFLLHEWGECNYPGGYFDLLFAKRSALIRSPQAPS